MRVSAQKHAVSTSSSCRLDRALQPKLFARGTATAQQSTLASTTAARLTSKKSVTSYTFPCTTSQQDCRHSAKRPRRCVSCWPRDTAAEAELLLTRSSA
jgi:predicted lipoprotein with Yx(FWY)xxD motif